MPHSILVIDDQIKTFRKSLEETLDTYDLLFAENGKDGIAIIERQPVSLVLLDVRMPACIGSGAEREGIAVLQLIKKKFPRLPVVMLTVAAEIETVVEAIKQGAFHYVQKPPDRAKLIEMIESALENSRLKDELNHLKHVVQLRDSLEAHPTPQNPRESLGTLIGKSPLMQALYQKMEKIAGISAAVIIRGPTGSGKELVARELHRLSGRSGAFVPVNCAAIPGDLLESELFGHEKGAFTDALVRKPGMFEQAHQGTVLLDEIADMPLALQSKLLRVLQDKKITPVGANHPIQVDVRIISATNKFLEDMMKDGLFREDLYYRLNVISLELPGLRERKDDIPLLTEYFIRRYCAEFNKCIRSVRPEVVERLSAYAWPGNVRELESTLQKLIALCEGDELTARHLELPLAAEQTEPDGADSLWREITNASFRIKDLTAFRNEYGSKMLERIISRAIEHTLDIKAAGMLIGYIPEDDTGEKYANFRQWLNRMGMSKKSILKDKSP